MIPVDPDLRHGSPTTSHEPSGPPLPRLTRPWSVRVAESDGPDLEIIHGWMHAAHVSAFWKQNWSRQRWSEELERQRAGSHSLPCLLDHDGTTVAYVEVYRVLRDRLADYYAYGPADLGVHVAVGEIGRTGQGLGRRLLRAVAEGLLAADSGCDRVVAEPDVHNAPSIKAFQAAGFRPIDEVVLPDKTAALLVHPRHVGGASTEEDQP